jgi:hypothetical protein
LCNQLSFYFVEIIFTEAGRKTNGTNNDPKLAPSHERNTKNNFYEIKREELEKEYEDMEDYANIQA